MSVEEMIDRLLPYADAIHDGHLFQSVIEALRAGDKMRKSAKTELSEATKAWDAATKEDV
jgi:hypothetical protein